MFVGARQYRNRYRGTDASPGARWCCRRGVRDELLFSVVLGMDRARSALQTLYCPIRPPTLGSPSGGVDSRFFWCLVPLLAGLASRAPASLAAPRPNPRGIRPPRPSASRSAEGCFVSSGLAAISSARSVARPGSMGPARSATHLQLLLCPATPLRSPSHEWRGARGRLASPPGLARFASPGRWTLA